MEKRILISDFEKKNKNMVFREGNKQVLLIGVNGELFAIDNRCPHEGYPLSEGTTDSKDCVLTCNWHNWKFDLKTGECLVGGDNVRTYPVRKEEREIVVDLKDPTQEEIRDSILGGLEVGFRKRQYGRISRELARLDFSGIDPLCAIKSSLLWSYDRFEFGMTHAYAALADWLNLYFNSESREDRIICLTETIDHMAFDSLRHAAYPYSDNGDSYTDKGLLEAIEGEKREVAESLINDFFKQGRAFKELEPVLYRAALEHYNDFGHSLIYAVKCFEISGYLNDPEVDRALALCLVRSLCYATREDLIPEFKRYKEILNKLNELSFGEGASFEELPKVTVNKAYDWLVQNIKSAGERELYDYILKMNAKNFLTYDLNYQAATQNPVSKNVGWLDYTHAITFANAVRLACEVDPSLWKAGLLQMVSFYGRNTSYTDDAISLDDWRVEDQEEFKSEVLDVVFDHGLSGPIFSAHIIKTGIAVFGEMDNASEETSCYLAASLNRFLNSPLKQKHVRRIVTQGVNLVSKDF